ncbi:MAG: Fic family protein [Oscillospiraceae bacterium]
MPVILPTKDEIININKGITKSSNSETRIAEGSLNFALDSQMYDQDDSVDVVCEAAYRIARAIACDHTFVDGNKRTATVAVKKLFANNGFTFNGADSNLLDLVSSLVKEDGDDDDEVKENFIRGLSELFTL